MAKYLGWLNVGLLCLSLVPSLLRQLCNRMLRKPSKTLNKFLKHSCKIHPFAGPILVITGFLHGYMALGTVRLHTGYLTWFTILTMLTLRILGKATKSIYWLTLHKAVALMLVIFLLIHIFARNIL